MEIKMEKQNRKGELTSAQLIGIILLVVGFAIILIFWYIYNPSEGIDKDACYNSIVLRSSMNFVGSGTADVIPLRCKTEKICLTMSGDDCEEFGASTKKFPVTKIKLDENNPRKDAMDAIATSMYDCHSMLGEGKLNFMPAASNTEKYGLICSRIAFDKTAKDKISDIKYGELYERMSELKNPNGKSYLEYVYPGWNNWKDAERVFNDLKTKGEQADKKVLDSVKDFDSWKIVIKNPGGYAVVSTMTKPGTLISKILAGGAFIGTSVLGAVVGIPSIGIKAGAIVGGAVLYYTHPGNKFNYASPTLYSYDLQTLRSLEINSFETAP